MGERKYYIDNLRWLCILLLIPFHGAMAWNNWEGNYIWFEVNKVLSSFVIFVSPWFMPLMFVLAGMSTRYAFRKRSYKQYAIERIQKLLLPLLTGTITVAAFMAYMADRFFHHYCGSFFSHYQVFFTNLTDLTSYDGAFTPGHLWFILYLFLISMLSLLIIMLQRKFLPNLLFSSMKSGILPVLMVLPLIMTPILNIGGKSIGQFLALYLLGYYVLAEETIQEKLAKQKNIYLPIMLIFDVVEVYLFVWKGQRTGWFLTLCSIISLWFGVLGILGLGKVVFNRITILTSYLSKQSFSIYIFHFGWLVTFQYYLGRTPLPLPLVYGLSVVFTLVFTLLTCEAVKRIPGVRWLYGIKKK